MITDIDIKKLKTVFATKEDLKSVKADVKDIKNDLKNFATKEDLKHFATKDDLKNFATKKDLVGLARVSDIEDLRITFIDKLAEWKSELYTKIDAVLGRLKTAEEENAILNAKDEGRQEVRAVEVRLKSLEDLHAPGSHHMG